MAGSRAAPLRAPVDGRRHRVAPAPTPGRNVWRGAGPAARRPGTPGTTADRPGAGAHRSGCRTSQRRPSSQGQGAMNPSWAWVAPRPEPVAILVATPVGDSGVFCGFLGFPAPSWKRARNPRKPCAIEWWPQRDSNPCFSLERAVGSPPGDPLYRLSSSRNPSTSSWASRISRRNNPGLRVS